MKLHSHIPGLEFPQSRIFRISEDARSAGKDEALLTDGLAIPDGRSFPLVLSKTQSAPRIHRLPDELHYLQAGDVVKLTPRGEVFVLYRKASRHNALFITERCNSKCLMCSQPPRDIDDDYLIDDWLKAIPLMSPETRELGITGGEPTLKFHGLLKLIESVKLHLPDSSLHMLSNGRLFAYLKYADAISRIGHPDFMIGIPLYADLDSIHDFVVQAKGAFGETVRGILNLGRVNQKVEIRVVIHRQTYARLPHLARFIARNLPFVSHVALMGLEITGYTRTNLDALWIDPVEYRAELEEAVNELVTGRLHPSIYNLPLCLLPHGLWPYARQSISDWKNIYLDACAGCTVKEFCAGFFASAVRKCSSNLRALGETEYSYAVQFFHPRPS